jgi:hypothetical protein
MGPPRRLFVFLPALSSRTRFLAPQLDSIVDSLRSVLARDKRYVLVPVDSVKEMQAQTQSINQISEALNVDLFATPSLSLLPDSTVMWQVRTRDLSAHSAYASRTVVTHTDRSNMMKQVDSLVFTTTRMLKEQDHAPRRTPSGDHRPR